ncbi:MAG: hypothetical protein WCG29_12445 [Desulfomonile sp.]
MAALVLAVSFFTAVYIGYKPKLQILALHALYATQGIFGVPNFRYYVLADGIREILSKAGNGTLQKKRHKGGPNDRLPLFLT